MKCEDVPTYLRNTLKVPDDTYISVRSTSHDTVDALAPVMKALNASGYRKVIGTIVVHVTEERRM